jgi:hypothetical protein
MERVIRWCGTAAIRALGPAAVEESVAAFTLCRMAGIGYYAEPDSLRAPSRASCVSASGLRPLPDCRREELPLSQRSQTSNLTRHARLSGATLGRRSPERTHWNRQVRGWICAHGQGGGLSATRGRPRQRPVGGDRRARRQTVTATGSRAFQRWRVRGKHRPGALGGLYGRMATYAHRDGGRRGARDRHRARSLAQGNLRLVARPVGRQLPPLRLSGRLDHLYPR